MNKPSKIRPTQIQTTDENRFWMISVEGCKGPKKRHDDFTSVYAEAARMAACNPGKSVSVLESVGSVVLGDKLGHRGSYLASLQKGKEAIEKMIAELSTVDQESED